MTTDAKALRALVNDLEQADWGLANAYSATHNDYDKDRLACERLGMQRAIKIAKVALDAAEASLSAVEPVADGLYGAYTPTTVTASTALAHPQAAPSPGMADKPLRYCDYCKAWQPKPCGAGCVWRPDFPTVEHISPAAPVPSPTEARKEPK